jgi:lipopolysaccharide/colanic/teichoic acid biosynthesis glycosyltransferase
MAPELQRTIEPTAVIRLPSNQRAMSVEGTSRGEADQGAFRRLGLTSEAPDKQRASGRPGATHGFEEDATESRVGLGAHRVNGSSLKRLVDFAFAFCGLLALAPFLLLVAFMIRIESPGPALFRQRRTGRGGATFMIYKFRTMRVTEDGPTIRQASRTDDRRTKLGVFLRRSCIDELPQLINVLKGDMSLIGPRPHALAHDEYYSTVVPDYSLRLLVRPGLSGLAQVCGHRGATPDIESMAKRVASDLEYIENWSFGMDMNILLRTVFEGPFHPSAY